jgi:hypothetical protein
MRYFALFIFSRELLASPQFVEFMRKVKPVEVIPVVQRNKHPIVRGEYSMIFHPSL